jgi:hypothetical protein
MGDNLKMDMIKEKTMGCYRLNSTGSGERQLVGSCGSSQERPRSIELDKCSVVNNDYCYYNNFFYLGMNNYCQYNNDFRGDVNNYCYHNNYFSSDVNNCYHYNNFARTLFKFQIVIR